MIETARLRLRAPRAEDLDALAAILAEPEVARFWPAYDRARVHEELIRPDGDKTVLTIERREGGEVLGAAQFEESANPEYPHAGIDVFLATRAHGHGLGTETLRALVRHLFVERGQHRIVIDPTADNARAIRAYEQVGFRTVGLMRAYQREPDSSFRDGLLMELLAADAGEPAAARAAACALRAASLGDMPFLLESMVAFNRGEGIAWDPAAGAAPLRRLLGDAHLGRVAILVADGADVGYAVITHGYDLEFGGPDAFLTELYLVPEARRRGLARQAIALLMGELTAAGFGALHLQVRADNVAAQRLYRGAGFEGTTRMFLSRRLGR
jgi:aminoglycoside 6'-N-acetyltransferase